jgi:hypothetical protein
MTLTELITKVKEKHLTKDQLENYRDELSGLFAQLMLEMAEIQKEKAIFIENHDAPTDIAKKRKWAVTPKGQREIELKAYSSATKEMLTSLRNRLFNFY